MNRKYNFLPHDHPARPISVGIGPIDSDLTRALSRITILNKNVMRNQTLVTSGVARFVGALVQSFGGGPLSISKFKFNRKIEQVVRLDSIIQKPTFFDCVHYKVKYRYKLQAIVSIHALTIYK